MAVRAEHDRSMEGSQDRGTFYIEHDGGRSEYGSLRAALDYFRGCALDETVGTPVYLFDAGGKLVAALDWDGLGLPEIGCPTCGRMVKVPNASGGGWISPCGRRLTRREQCGVGGCIDPEGQGEPTFNGEPALLEPAWGRR